jgi:hypothetical protein
MSCSQWGQIKGAQIKGASPSRGKEEYDPTAKYDLIFWTVWCHNMNYCTLWAELDNAADESIWGFGGFMADAGGWLINKPVGKGGQTTMIFDVSRHHPLAYGVHQNACYVSIYPHNSPQSTGATNNSSINNLPLAKLYATIKGRGKHPNRRYWGIKQNKRTYLGHYYGINTIANMIKNAKIRFTKAYRKILDICHYDTCLPKPMTMTQLLPVSRLM